MIPANTQPPFSHGFEIAVPRQHIPYYRCNSCGLEFYKEKYGRKLLVLHERGWTTLYLRDEVPGPGQIRNEYEGIPIQFVVSYHGLGHTFDSDCGKRIHSDWWYEEFSEDTTGYGDQP